MQASLSGASTYTNVYLYMQLLQGPTVLENNVSPEREKDTKKRSISSLHCPASSTNRISNVPSTAPLQLVWPLPMLAPLARLFCRDWYNAQKSLKHPNPVPRHILKYQDQEPLQPHRCPDHCMHWRVHP
eukprot:TRINITY_DN7447_c0_g2_i2.p1 TRINITY_DN7447_c0_g2~~TRINITY_DN7447_c0_g2_i2.p1  ORF type:complete len:129 (+),score=14.62 TRINITY_DN7447_c0_g2_i2:225-611(+)